MIKNWRWKSWEQGYYLVIVNESGYKSGCKFLLFLFAAIFNSLLLKYFSVNKPSFKPCDLQGITVCQEL